MNQPDTTTNQSLLTAEHRAEIDRWLEKFPDDRRRSALLAALHIAQDNNGGWLSPELITEVADYLEIPASWAYEAASFYSMFHLKPVGRHKISICTNISCMLCGANDIVGHVEKKLGIKLGETTDDDRITLVVEEECLAGCVGAPMMVVDGHYHENLTPEKVDQILDSLE